MVPKMKKAKVGFHKAGDALVIELGGDWSMRSKLPDTESILEDISDSKDGRVIKFQLEPTLEFDTILASFIFRLDRVAKENDLAIELETLPEQLRRLLELGSKVPEKEDARKPADKGKGLLTEIGELAISYFEGSMEIATFTGEWIQALFKLMVGRARIRWEDFWHITRSVSLDALPIVALISFLVGAIISFLGAVTLKQFGAEFAVSYLVGYGILREMGAIMTGIIIAGRTGAAFAAQIGSMKINEEIDALKTLGISPVEFIVLPRLLALFVMMPLLTLYSNVIGIFSGWIVAEGLMGVPGPIFFTEMQSVVGLGDFLLGIFKSFVFGVLVATSGCLRGLQCGSGAGAVGIATTRAVVAGITLIVFSNAVIDWAAATLGI
jgi:phospholipid/cholesterol/gamma-HCH transport system permease protein